MECNKDESIRAKAIAEDKIKKKDYPGARKFALKARSLYPDLDGLTQILTMADVYISSENKISGETDWYGVLGVNPSSDDESIRKQYRKLALMLHPDKNKSVGADGAFNVISEAWNLLSDKVKRLAYNQRRGYRGQQQKVQMHAGGPSGSSNPNQTSNIPKTQNNASVPNQNPKPKPPPTPAPSNKSSTFWTICFRCKMHYEYLKVYLNNTLLCPNCHEAFMATETSPPCSFTKSSNQAPPRHHGSNNHIPSQNSYDQVKPAQKSGSGSDSPRYSHGKGISFGSTDPSIAAKAANVVQQAQDKVKTHDPVRNSQKSGLGSDPLRYSHGKGNNVGSTDPLIYAKAANVVQQAHDKVKTHDPVRQSQKFGFGSDSPRYSHGKGNNVGGTEPSIAAKAANVIQQAQNKVKRAYNELHGGPAQAQASVKKMKFDDNNSRYGMNYQNRAQGSNTSFNIGASGSKFYGVSSVNRRPNSTRDLTTAETRAMLMAKSRKDILNMINTSERKTTTTTTKADDKEKKDGTKGKCDENKTTEEEPVDESMIVPDPDFHDFDSDRTETSFGDNEVWAAYDDEDGMPRFYAMISKVISKKPFKLRIGWLNSKTTDEFGSLEWVGSGFYKTCGEFRVGKYETSKSINSFSQKVNWTRGPRGSVLILPQKGDVWALYKNWSTEWTESTPDDVIYKYEMVMVLDDYDKVKGVSVAPLLKVAGFKTIFRPSEEIRKVPNEEMLRFSHRVPKFLLTGLEGSNAPKGCLELDPAATPLELLQVT